MIQIEVEKIIEPLAASDGAGVKLKRSIGTHLIDYHDPFLMLDEFGSENKDDYIGGFPPHPHRGIETVTYMLSGEFEHEDSTGAKGKMSAGDVQWMKTGGGIIHSEMPTMAEGKLTFCHCWHFRMNYSTTSFHPLNISCRHFTFSTSAIFMFKFTT